MQLTQRAVLINQRHRVRVRLSTRAAAHANEPHTERAEPDKNLPADSPKTNDGSRLASQTAADRFTKQPVAQAGTRLIEPARQRQQMKHRQFRHRPGTTCLISRNLGDRDPACRSRLQINPVQPSPELLDQSWPHRIHHRPVNPAQRGYQHVGRATGSCRPGR
jgi:hypothetical protein